MLVPVVGVNLDDEGVNLVPCLHNKLPQIV
jgi:hypothetical protein